MIAILGATGHVGGRIADILIKKGENVRLIARSVDKLRPFVGKKAQAFVGDANDTEFLVKAFKEVDAVFTLIPPNMKAEKVIDYQNKIGESIARAVEIAGVKHVVNLSSVGAELSDGTGPIQGLHNMEERLNAIKGLNVLHLRPAYFMENLLWGVDLIKAKGINGDTLRGDLKLPMIASKDVAVNAADCLIKRDFTGSSVRHLFGPRDLSLIEATEIIGRKIGKPGLTYVMFPEAAALKDMVSWGLSPDVSRSFIEMTKAFNEGRIRSEKRSAEGTTPTSLEEFCDQVFAPLYNQKKAA